MSGFCYVYMMAGCLCISY